MIFALAFLVGSLAAAPAQAAPQEPLAWPLELRGHMLRLNDVEWRLRVAAGAQCAAPGSASGLTIDHIAAYDRREHDALQNHLGMTGLPQIAAVARDSPAALAGIKPGDDIRTINGIAVDAIIQPAGDPALLAEDLMDWLATQPAGKAITFQLRRDDVTLRKNVTPIALCTGRAILKTDDALDAYSDDHDLAITTGMIGFTADDDELALIVGHELAHVILQHGQGGPAGELRRREIEADMVGARLAHCAGYNVVNGSAFWQRYGARQTVRWSHLSTHASPEKRQRGIAAAAPGFSCPVSLPAQASSARR